MERAETTFPNTVYRVSTKAFITNEEWKLLLIYEGKEWSWWRELPWWWLDFGEEPRAWLKREIYEEIWVEAVIPEDRPIYVWTDRLNHMNMHFLFLWYKVQINTADIKMNLWNDINEEIVSQRKFFSKDELKTINLRENIRKVPEIFNPKDFL